MAAYGRRERITRTVEFSVPAEPPYGAAWTEVMKAIRAAHNELHQLDPERYPEGRDVPDDAIWLRPGDDDIIVCYEREVTE